MSRAHSSKCSLPGRLRPLAVVAQEVLDRRARAVRVEGRAAVGQREEQHAAGAQHADEVLQRGDRVLEVLEHVVGDHEVQRRVGERRERRGVVDDVRLGDRLGVAAGRLDRRAVLVDELLPRDAVDVAHAGGRRDAQRPRRGADLDAVAAQVAAGEVLAVQAALDRPEAEHPVAHTAAGTGGRDVLQPGPHRSTTSRRGTRCAQRVGQLAAVADGRVGLQAQQRGARARASSSAASASSASAAVASTWARKARRALRGAAVLEEPADVGGVPSSRRCS